MNKVQIDPKTQMVITFLVGILSFLGTNALPHSVSPSAAAEIHDWAVWLTQLYVIAIAPLLTGFSNSNPGPLAPPDSPAVKAAMKGEAK